MWRALVFAGVAGLISLALNWFGQDTEAVYLIVWGVAAVLGIWPEPIKEIKQKFKVTPARGAPAGDGVCAGGDRADRDGSRARSSAST